MTGAGETGALREDRRRIEAGAPGPGLRICMIIASYHPIVGGAEKQVAQLSRLMADQGHDLRVVTRRYPGLPAFETIDGVPVERIAQPGPKPVRAAAFTLGAALAVRRMRPDIVHCHSMFTPALAGLLATAGRRTPLLVKPMCGGEASDIAAKPLGRARIAALGRRAGRIVAVSGEIEAELRGLGIPAAAIARIPNGVDTARFRPSRSAADKTALRAELGLPEGTLFLFAGRIARQKRLPLLLQVWGDVMQTRPDARLLIAGANRSSADGADETDVSEALLSQPGVVRLGHVADMTSLFRAADVFVLPSDREGLSNALLEACASGLAPVAARIGGTEDVIEGGRNGLLFAPGDGAALGAAMARLAAAPELRAEIGAAAARTVAERFAIARTAASLIATYRTLLGQDASPEGLAGDTTAAQPG